MSKSVKLAIAVAAVATSVLFTVILVRPTSAQARRRAECTINTGETAGAVTMWMNNRLAEGKTAFTEVQAQHMICAW